MRNGKFLAAAATAFLLGIGGANAAPAHHEMHRAPPPRHETHRPYVDHDHVRAILRAHHYRMAADPYFVHGHYVVRTTDRRGRVVFVEVNPYTGAFVGEIRL